MVGNSARPPLFRRARNFIGRSWLGAFGWSLDSTRPPAKAVVVAAPHTSNWDFPFTMAVAWALDLDIAWLGKHTLFRPPFRGFFESLGGIPVDRRSPQNLVAQVADRLRSADRLLIIVSPEGTRGSTDRWKTGFYRIATAAEVPIVLGFLDFGNKRGGLGVSLTPSGDLARDAETIRAFYRGMKGKNPEKFTEVKFEGLSHGSSPDVSASVG